MVHHLGVDQVVDQDDIGLAQGLDGLERQQFRIAGAGADENDLACIHAVANRKICSTCRDIEPGTGLRPASTSRM